MSITNFKPQIWSARLLVAWRKSLVYGGPMVVNRDYEGDIAESGDVVKITSISDPTISDYVPNSTVITPEELTDAQRNLVIDQSKYWAFKVDDVDKRQAKGNVMPEAMSRAAYRLRDVADQYIAGLYTGVASGNNLGTISVVAATPTDAYDDVLIPLKVTLDDGDCPTEGRYCVVPPWFTGRLLRDDRFVRADASGSTDALRNGFVGRAAGFNIVQSNNTPNPTGDDNVVQAGVNSAISFAEQINKTEAYRPESSFSDAVKGLALYGAKLVRPDGIAIATASQT
ncbi:P22 phage major capsid protein family protein [Streptomyces scabiei]|uniref:P22 phage major capsid protein family protein n=1 Tax=Streptomyces scabiei TaxID=1930 RepID=UPI001B33426C|nr:MULTISPECIES: P22 phage major capsid protein family protein [Streptomyces]MBP5915868.1 P22 coat protein - protein 5 domain protein [Streptomyces sp. LBUM 1486]MDX2626485.1 P22 phage major capsid protein family protein [Streptomyces scabiei]MDX3028591.1 P22 phage major capsid protein family protein [Streptomyces scabiei]MDX3168284.1 P22 phage major capsid protein family protein [Streptomyces scabiei]MDX3207339.1 P22 phage major capsid protein family protein [Streptomyces scabiei]